MGDEARLVFGLVLAEREYDILGAVELKLLLLFGGGSILSE